MTGTASRTTRSSRSSAREAWAWAYKAEDTRLDRLVAIKTIRGASQSNEGRKQLWREARSLARVSHPRICQLFDAVVPRILNAGHEGGSTAGPHTCQLSGGRRTGTPEHALTARMIDRLKAGASRSQPRSAHRGPPPQRGERKLLCRPRWMQRTDPGRTRWSWTDSALPGPVPTRAATASLIRKTCDARSPSLVGHATQH
jgi:serine/threonine protein kinase